MMTSEMKNLCGFAKQIVLGILLLQVFGWGASRGDVNVLEATESIRYLSQKMAREYLYVYLNPDNRFAHQNLQHTIESLGKNIRTVSAASSDEETVTMIEFIAYTKEQIIEIIEQKPSKENATLMLDYSETLLEGTDAIARAHLYNFSNEEKMLVTSKNLQYLLERLLKYYLALYIGDTSQNTKKQLEDALLKFTAEKKRIDAYRYPKKLSDVVKKIDEVWNRTGPYIVKAKEYYFIPDIVSDAVSYMEKHIDSLVLYHSKKL